MECGLANLGKLQIPVSYKDLTGQQGEQGEPGKTILYGTVAPTTEGSDGDFYIDTETNTLYGPKASGVWLPGVTLVGPPGPQGVAVLNTGYGAFTSIVTGSWVEAKSYSLPASYIQDPGDEIEIEVQGRILASSIVIPPNGGNQGKVRIRWSSDFSYEGPVLVSTSPVVDQCFVLNMRLYVAPGGTSMFYNASMLSTPKPFGTNFPALDFTGGLSSGEFTMADPSIAQELRLDIWNSNPLRTSQIEVSSFVIKSYKSA